MKISKNTIFDCVYLYIFLLIKHPVLSSGVDRYVSGSGYNTPRNKISNSNISPLHLTPPHSPHLTLA